MRYFILALTLFMITGCGKNTPQNNNNETPIIEDTNEVKIEEQKINIGIYDNVNLELVKSHSNKWLTYKDILLFTTVLSNEERINGGSFQDIWASYTSKYTNMSEYKIGYHVNFKLKNGITVDKTITSLDDLKTFEGYLYIYLYDDVNVGVGVRHSHLEAKDITEKTLFTSIKLTGAESIDDVLEPITLANFIYKNSELDSNGNYTGSNYYKIEIYRN